MEEKERIKQWLLNGVSIKEIQERLSWLGISVTQEAIKRLENE